MTLPAPTYDLVLLLDPQADDVTRKKLVADSRAAIEAQGEFLRHDEWGERALAYPIDRKANAEYHLLQFHASAPELLGGLDRTLRLADEVLRHRIIKLAPGVPAPPSDMSSSAVARQPEGDPQAQAGTAPASEPETAPQPEAETAPEGDPEPAPAAEPAPEAPAEVAAEAEVAVGEPS